MANIPLTTSIRTPYEPARSRLAKRWSGVIGCSARRSFSTKATSSTTAGHERRDRARVGPSGRGGPDEAVDQGGHAEGGGGRAGQVEVPAPALRLGQVPRGEDHQHHADRDVDEQAHRQDTQLVSMPPSTRPMLPPPPATAL